jgi:hypothetical protein
MDQLYTYLDPQAALMPEGSWQIPLRWGGLLAWTIGLASIIPLLIGLIKRKTRGNMAEEA